MDLKTELPRLNSFTAAASGASLEVTVIALCLLTLSTIICFSAMVKTTATNFPVFQYPDWSKTHSGRPTAPSSLSWPRLLREAADKYDKPYIVNYPDRGKMVMLPPKYSDDVKNNKDMSLDVATKTDFFPEYPGFEAIRAVMTDHIFHDAVRVKLTQSLSFFTQELSQEAKHVLPILFPAQDSWNTTHLYPALTDFVTRLSALVFVGKDFEGIREYREISATYALNLFNAARTLRQWRPWLRPLVHWFLPETTKLRAQVKLARSFIEQEVKRRRVRRREALGMGTQPTKSLDSVDWFEETAKGKRFDFVAGELLLSVVAVHTTTGTLANVILDICDNPHLFNPLREETISVIKEDGHLRKTSLHKLVLMDSVLKENQRIHPLGQANLHRCALKDVTLHDRTVLPKGTFAMSSLLNFDEGTFPDPYRFDGFRFLELRRHPGGESKWQFSATQSEHMAFGHGVHACLGRFFASNELKIALMHMLMKYDWRFPEDGQKRPESLEFGLETPPNPAARIEFRSRAAEVDF